MIETLGIRNWIFFMNLLDALVWGQQYVEQGDQAQNERLDLLTHLMVRQLGVDIGGNNANNGDNNARNNYRGENLLVKIIQIEPLVRGLLCLSCHLEPQH